MGIDFGDADEVAFDGGGSGAREIVVFGDGDLAIEGTSKGEEEGEDEEGGADEAYEFDGLEAEDAFGRGLGIGIGETGYFGVGVFLVFGIGFRLGGGSGLLGGRGGLPGRSGCWSVVVLLLEEIAEIEVVVGRRGGFFGLGIGHLVWTEGTCRVAWGGRECQKSNCAPSKYQYFRTRTGGERLYHGRFRE